MTRPARRRAGGKRRPIRQARRAMEDLLVAAAADRSPGSALVPLIGGTSLALALHERLPHTELHFWTMEHFFARSLAELLPDLTWHGATGAATDADNNHVDATRSSSGNAASGGVAEPQAAEPAAASDAAETGSGSSSGNRRWLSCSADPPERPVQAVLIGTAASDPTELTHELLQFAHQRLPPDGRLIAATTNADDSWLGERIQSMFRSVTTDRRPEGTLYTARPQPSLRKVRSFTATAKFRFLGRLYEITTRPGVFCHRDVDGGARALIRSLAADLSAPAEGVESVPLPSLRRIAELGCGSGAVAVAAAAACPEADVLAIDSHARAVACTAENAAANGLSNIRVLLDSDAAIPQPETWDLVLTNPPYYSDYRISELFLKSAKRALRRGGSLRLVTRLTEWHVQRMQQLFNDVGVRRFGEYDVISGIRR